MLSLCAFGCYDRTTMAKKVHTGQGSVGLRLVALFEAVKGLLILGLGFGFLALRHTDVHAVADTLLARFGVNPEAHYPRLFIEHLSQVGDGGLFWFAVGALFLSMLRFTEAIGLWLAMHWAEWLTFIASGVYLPFEIHHIWVKPDLFGFGILGANLAIIYYLGRVLMANRRERLERSLARVLN